MTRLLSGQQDVQGKHARGAPQSKSDPPLRVSAGAAGGLPRFLQTKLLVNTPGDAFEREADNVASVVTRGTRERMRLTPVAASMQRKGDSAASAKSAGLVHRVAGATTQSVPARVRAQVEPIIGADLSDVRVHSGPDAWRSTKALQARAFTHQREIWLGERESVHDVALMAHEATHVVQQTDVGTGRDNVIQRQTDASTLMSTDPGAAPVDPSALMTPSSGESAARAVAAEGPPVLWGLDMSATPRRTYLSVLAPGHTLAEIATYLYGEPAMAGALGSANGAVSGFLTAGTTLKPVENGTISQTASSALNQAIESGTVLRSKGIPTEASSAPQMYMFSAGGRSFQVTEGQFLGMMQGAATWLLRKAQFLHDTAESGRWVHHDHITGTNSVIRGISDWMGDTTLPPESMWDVPERESQAVIDALNNREMTLDSQPILGEQVNAVLRAAEGLDFAQVTWREYINATIEGAERSVHKLEIVRNVSFGIAAGLAGAIAAPAVLAAAPGLLAGVGATGLVTTTAAGTLGLTTAGTVVAGTVAVGVGATAGGVTGATLEFTGAVGGEALAKQVTPGAQNIDWGYVGHRTAEGYRSGYVQGGIGAAGALAAPAVSGMFANQLYGTTVAGLTTTSSRVIVNAATGATIGLPSGAAGAGIENYGAYRRGEMTGGQYASSIGLGGAFGGVAGAAFSFVPIRGLYRTGGTPGVPFSGEPVTPRWMLAGFGSPLSRGAFQASWNPPPGFNMLRLNELPPLLDGYVWMEVGGRFEPMAVNGAMTDPVTVRLYGPDAQGRYNYNFYQNSQLVGSRAFTRVAPANFQGVPGATRGDYPMTTADFTDPVTGQRYVRGHNIDFVDTAQPPNTPANQLSTMDPLNFTPEEADWGMHVRRLLVGEIRAASGTQGQYRQIEFYDPANPPRFTANGRRIPDGVYFAEYDSVTGQPSRAWLVRYSQSPGFRTLASAAQFSIPVNQLPPVIHTTPLLTVPAGGASEATRQTTSH